MPPPATNGVVAPLWASWARQRGWPGVAGLAAGRHPYRHTEKRPVPQVEVPAFLRFRLSVRADAMRQGVTQIPQTLGEVEVVLQVRLRIAGRLRQVGNAADTVARIATKPGTGCLGRCRTSERQPDRDSTNADDSLHVPPEWLIYDPSQGVPAQVAGLNRLAVRRKWR